MRAALKMPSHVPIYVLSGSPHPDTPRTTAGKAAVAPRKTPAFPQAGPRRRPPPADGASVFAY